MTKQKKRPTKRLPEAMKKTQFKPGQSGNPNGRPPLNPIQRALKNLTIDTYREVIELVLTGNLDALKEMIENPKTSAIQVGVATSCLKAIKSGDYTVIERIAERIVGKIPDEINVRSTNKTDTTFKIDPLKLKAAIASIEDEI